MSVIGDLDRLARGRPPQAPREVDAWRAELATLRAAQAPWPFAQVYPNLDHLIDGERAGAGWSVELGLLVARWGVQVPLSGQALRELQAQARQHHGPVRSSDQ